MPCLGSPEAGRPQQGNPRYKWGEVGQTSIWPIIEKQLGVPKCIYKHYPNTPHSYNEDNFDRLSLRILRLEKRAFCPYGPPIMRVGHVSVYGVKSNIHLGSSKVVRFTWDTALCKCAPIGPTTRLLLNIR